ncbi:MAG: 1-acyl-sn-glycerol-3-phosphate acyltransferase [Acidobacteriota bacterium]|nr:1-acyl-sn-glycerol-3-phosphate acyltransferase [Acidobacteriota bacterium]
MNEPAIIKPEIRQHPSYNWPNLNFAQKAYYILRSIFVWIISILHFFPICSALVLMGYVIDPRKNDRPQRWLFRNILRVAGVDFEVNYAVGFDRTRTSFFISNHVDLWDAFIIYSAIPQFVRGLEHESHFKIPAYGWMMRRFGNVPVPPEGNLAKYKQMMKQTRERLDAGVSLIVFAEGSRTRDGFVHDFNPGAFRMAIQYGYPIAPMSIVGAYEFSRKGDWKLFPSKVTVYMHDTIETAGLGKNDVEPLRQRVQAIVAQPVNEYYGVAAATSVAIADQQQQATKQI